MSTLVISSDFDLSNPQDIFGANAVIVSRKSTGWKTYDEATGNEVTLSGTNIQYGANGSPVSGKVTSIISTVQNGRETLFNLTNANIDVAVANQLEPGAPELAYWLGPNPSVTTVPGGINGFQSISAPSGVNQIYGYTGNNQVVYNDSSANFTVSLNSLSGKSNGVLTVTQGDPEVSSNVNTLHAIQTIKFANQGLQTDWFTKATILHDTNPSEFNTLIDMYIGYFNRAPGGVGISYWAAQVVDGQTNSQIANTFATTPEAIATYGTVTPNSSVAELHNFVTGVYENVLNRAPRPEGLNYWTQKLQSGEVSPGDFILKIISDVNAQVGTADKLYLSSKESVGAHFAITNGLTNVDQASHVMEVFNAAYSARGAQSAIYEANSLSDSYLNNLDQQPQLIVQVIGVHE